MTWEHQVRFELLQPLKLLDVYVHITRSRRDKNCTNACNHISGNKPSFGIKANVSRVVTGRDQNTPFLRSQLKDISILKDSVAMNRSRGVLTSPYWNIKRFTKQIHVADMVAMRMGEEYGNQFTTMSINGFSKLFHPFPHTTGRIDENKFPFRVANKIGIGVVCRRKCGCFDWNNLDSMRKKD